MVGFMKERTDMSENDFGEYVTFVTTDSEGHEIEMAVVDEFDYDNRHYVAAALIENDTINEDGLYIYKAVMTGDDFKVEKIHNKIDYEKVARAYMEMEE